jgi:methionyl-tRNA formyltransferase
VTPRPQSDDPDDSLRCYPRIPEDSRIDWSLPADRLARLVRASAEPLPGAYTFLDRERLTVWRARAEPAPNPYLGTPGQVTERRPSEGEVAVATGDEFLVLETVEMQDTGRVPATEAIRSHRTRLGMSGQEAISDVLNRVSALEERIAELEDET